MHDTIAKRHDLLVAFSDAVVAHHRGTAGHCARVALMAAALAQAFGVGDADREVISWAGRLHDLGKLRVSEATLNKVGPLDPDEWVEVRRHPVVGADMLIGISSRFAPMAAAVRSHHERWDGTGYPEGLGRDGIPLLGRLLAIVDVYDSVTHVRPYRSKVYGPAEGLQLIVDGAGSHFDADAVALFVSMHRNHAFQAVAFQAAAFQTVALESAAGDPTTTISPSSLPSRSPHFSPSTA